MNDQVDFELHDKTEEVEQEHSQAHEEICTQMAEKIDQIHLTQEDKLRIYSPWKFSIIIKLMGKRMLHQQLKLKI